MIRAFLLFLMLAVLPFPAAASDKILDVQVVKSKNGIEAWLVEDKTVPVISISFSFEGGLALDPDDKPGAGRLVSILMDEGAGDLDAQTFQKKLSDSAIALSFTAGRDAFYGEMKTLKANKALAFDLLRLALTKPRFDEDAIARMKNSNIAQIRGDLGDPSWLVARAFNGMMFEGHYYSRPGAGDLRSMETITRADLVEFAKSQFGRNVLKVSIAGDIGPEEAASMLDYIFGHRPAEADVPESKAAAITNRGKIILLPLDTPQTYISIGAEGIRRQDRDWHAATVASFILGGGSFDARLMREVREKRGLTYGVYSSLSSMKQAAVMQISLSASNENVAEALDIIRTQCKDLSEKGATPKELADAKSYLTGSLLLELTSTDDISGTLNSLQREGESPDYINKRNALIRAVTLDDVRRAAARFLKTGEMTTILVGKPEKISPDILLDKPPGMRNPQGND